MYYFILWFKILKQTACRIGLPRKISLFQAIFEHICLRLDKLLTTCKGFLVDSIFAWFGTNNLCSVPRSQTLETCRSSIFKDIKF